jgi:hypothetical protein
MSDMQKLEATTDKLHKLIDWAKQNTMLVGILVTVIPGIAVGGYNMITKFNDVKAMYEGYSDTASTANKAARKADLLEEKLNAQQEALIKLQERSSDALINAREAKLSSESTQREVRSLAKAQETQLQSMSDSMKTELNAIKRATGNRLGN